MPHPLQTRAAHLSTAWFAKAGMGAEQVQELRVRGYNTAVIPALEDGTVNFTTRSSGELKRRDCPGRRALEAAERTGLSVWLSIDFLTAGVPGGRKLGPLARENRHWLMKSVNGRLQPPQFRRIPGLFCWTTMALRRFVGNLAVDVSQGWPVDGLVLDLRHLPRPQRDQPATWMNASFSSIQRMNRELGIDIEAYFSAPTLEGYELMEQWRFAELALTIETIKARVQRFRANLPVIVLATLGEPSDPWGPWVPWVADGLIDHAMLLTTPTAMEEDCRTFDAQLDSPHPLLLAFDREADARHALGELHRLPASGFSVRKPVSGEAPLPKWPVTWGHFGAVESHPVPAAAHMLGVLAEQLKETRSLGSFLRRLHDFLTTTGEENALYEDLIRIRKDLLRIHRKILDGDYELDARRERLLTQLDFVARLLLLAPITTTEH